MNTSAPPSITCNVAEIVGVSMYRWRTQEIMESSNSTTMAETVMAALKLGIRNGNVWPMPPSAGEAAIVGERFGKTHADARAHGSSEADEKCVPTLVRCDGGGEQRCER